MEGIGISRWNKGSVGRGRKYEEGSLRFNICTIYRIQGSLIRELRAAYISEGPIKPVVGIFSLSCALLCITIKRPIFYYSQVTIRQKIIPLHMIALNWRSQNDVSSESFPCFTLVLWKYPAILPGGSLRGHFIRRAKYTCA